MAYNTVCKLWFGHRSSEKFFEISQRTFVLLMVSDFSRNGSYT